MGRISCSAAAVVVVVMAVVGGVVFIQDASAKPFDFSGLITGLADNVVDRLYVDREIVLLDHYCALTRRPYFYRWELHHRAQLTCPGWVPIVGKAKNFKNPQSAENEAVKDFVRKLVARGLVTREDVSEWL